MPAKGAESGVDRMCISMVQGEIWAGFPEEVASGPELEPWAAACKCPGDPGGKGRLECVRKPPAAGVATGVY